MLESNIRLRIYNSSSHLFVFHRFRFKIKEIKIEKCKNSRFLNHNILIRIIQNIKQLPNCELLQTKRVI